MIEVRRSALRDALLRNTTEERTREMMRILEPLFCMCAHDRFFYDRRPELPPEIHTSIAFLMNRPCDGTEFIAESVVPLRLMSAIQNTSFITYVRQCLEQRLKASLNETTSFNLAYDLRFSFGNRLLNDLPSNLWHQLWEIVRYWLLCEVAGKPFRKEALALEQMVRLCAAGNLAFGTKPSAPTILYLVNAKTAPPNTRFRAH